MKLRSIILNIIMTSVIGLVPAAALASTAYAACPSDSSPQGQVLSGVGQTGGNCSDAPVNNVFQTAVQILSIVVGVAAIIAIIYAGFKYIASGGDANKVANAKNTLIYAIVGLAVAGLAQVLIHFVLSTAANVK